MLQQDFQALLRLHRTLLPEAPQGLRTHDVFCVANTGQKIRFTAAAHVPGQLALILERSNELMRERKLVAALSVLWLGLIAVHPFSDGNGRVALAFVEKKAKEQGFSLQSAAELQSILLTEDTTENLKHLMTFFSTHLKQGSNHATLTG